MPGAEADPGEDAGLPERACSAVREEAGVQTGRAPATASAKAAASHRFDILLSFDFLASVEIFKPRNGVFNDTETVTDLFEENSNMVRQPQWLSSPLTLAGLEVRAD